jgi:hypothetical protein
VNTEIIRIAATKDGVAMPMVAVREPFHAVVNWRMGHRRARRAR